MVDLLLRGKGLYLYDLPSSGGANPLSLVNRLKAAGIAHVYIKIADGAQSWPRSGPDYTANVTAAAQAAGLIVWGWHYVYGNHPAAEAEIAAQRVGALGLSGYIFDAEKEYESTQKKAAAQTFVADARSLMPKIPFGFSSFKYPTKHGDLPWKIFASAADVLMPQVYWVGKHDPGAQLDLAAKEWGALNPGAVIAPTGAAYTEQADWRPTADDIKGFLTRARSVGHAAADFWFWDYIAKAANADLLDAIATFAYDGASPSAEAREDAIVVAGSPAELKLGEKRPPKPEVQICGAIATPIQRSDAAFAQLVKNTSPNIVFKDEEKTGADRMMTATLRNKLEALALLVPKEWPGSQLRVTEAWDEKRGARRGQSPLRGTRCRPDDVAD